MPTTPTAHDDQRAHDAERIWTACLGFNPFVAPAATAPREQIHQASWELDNALQQCRARAEQGRHATREYEAWREEAWRLTQDVVRLLALSRPRDLG